MPSDRKERLPHIILSQTAQSTRYTSPAGGGGSKFETPDRNRQQHANALLAQLSEVSNVIPEIKTQRDAIGLDAVGGIYLNFESEPGFELKFESLENRTSGIELLSLKEEGDKHIATVFVPDNKIQFFLNRVTQYRDEDGRGKTPKPKHQGLIEGISNIQLAVLKALWTDDSDLYPEDENEIFHWEVWLRQSSQVDCLQLLREHAEQLGINVGDDAIEFLDRTVVLVSASRAQMSRSVQLLASFAELRKAKETADFFTGMCQLEQMEWIKELIPRIQPPNGNAPAVCVLDTGVTRAHPLLEPVSSPEDMHTHNPAWGVDDRVGHGTPMAGLAVYGDLTKALETEELVPLTHHLESVKIVRQPDEENDRELYGAITTESVARPEIEKPERKRSYCLAVSTTDGRDRGKPSSWSATLDKLASGQDDNQKRLFIVSAGNTKNAERHHYPDSNLTDEVHDPGQAWNALTVGGYTEKVLLDTKEYPGWEPIAPPGDLSPASCTSMAWDKNWPIKPEIVMEAGNMARSPVDGTADYIDDGLQLLSTSNQFTLGKLLESFGDTSGACALASRLAAQVMANYPDLWPETVRALMVHSADWTDAMKARCSPLNNQAKKRQLLRYCGYGVPNENQLFWSAQDSLTLIAQDSLQPFMKEKSDIKTADLNLHDLPWPRDVLQGLGETDVEMRVTLSYFIESNPGERGWSTKFSYKSHGLRFDVKRATESDEQFQQRVNKLARDEDAKYEGSVKESGGEWYLGNKLQSLGSIHSDTWHGTAASLAERGYVAVYPVGGWWKERKALERWGNQARYALIISIRTPDVETDIYTPVANQVATVVPV